jgi:hypothetical protein
MKFYTLPRQDTIEKEYDRTPESMHPSLVPNAVVAEGYFTSSECHTMKYEGERFLEYQHTGCNAMTREIGHIPAFDTFRDLSHAINNTFFGYDLDEQPVSWMQSYGEDANYSLHRDVAPGQTRKLTAVIMLSDRDDYAGGDLTIYAHPFEWVVPATQGTVVVFQPWLPHKVTRVARGYRQTINMGFYGPEFK